MADLTALKVIECGYCYNVWEASIKDGKEILSGTAKKFAKRTDVDLYHLCGVYHTAKVPYEIYDIGSGSKPSPESIDTIIRDFSDAVYKGVSKEQGVLIAGGYCNYAPAILGGLQRALGKDKKIGVVWIDAHADNQIVEDFDEPIRLVGVPVTTFLGQTLPGYRQTTCGLEDPIDGCNVIISDARITLKDEEENMQSAEIVRLTSEEFADAEKWRSAVEALAARVDSIYLSVDIDILKPAYIPAYEVVSPGGHDIEVVMRNIAAVMNTGKVNVFSLFCVNFDHNEQGGEWTAFNGMKLIASGLHHWKTIGV